MTTYANVLTAPEIATRIVEAKFATRRLFNLRNQKNPAIDMRDCTRRAIKSLRNLRAKYQIASREDRAVSL